MSRFGRLVLGILCIGLVLGLVGCTKSINEKTVVLDVSSSPKPIIQDRIKDLQLLDLEYSIVGDYVYSTGSVKNIGTSDINYYEIFTYYLSDKGEALDSDYTNSAQILGVGEQRKFEVMHKYDDRFKEFRAKIKKVR